MTVSIEAQELKPGSGRGNLSSRLVFRANAGITATVGPLYYCRRVTD